MKTNKHRNLNKLTFIFIIISFLSSCGGGGSTPSEPPSPVDTSSSDWDSMVWDQDDWG